MMNVGVLAPRDGFLQELRALCNEFGFLLIFDEVKTGAKLAWGGAQEWYKVKADIVCLAKAIGGGLPLGAFGARREMMNEIGAVPLLPRRHLCDQPARDDGLHHGPRRGPDPRRLHARHGARATRSPKGTTRSSRSTG